MLLLLGQPVQSLMTCIVCVKQLMLLVHRLHHVSNMLCVAYFSHGMLMLLMYL